MTFPHGALTSSWEVSPASLLPVPTQFPAKSITSLSLRSYTHVAALPRGLAGARPPPPSSWISLCQKLQPKIWRSFRAGFVLPTSTKISLFSPYTDARRWLCILCHIKKRSETLTQQGFHRRHVDPLIDITPHKEQHKWRVYKLYKYNI